jgi:hypothetical protein
MTEDEREQIMREARANIKAGREAPRRTASPVNVDPMIRWRQQAAEQEALEERGKREIRAEEQRRTRAAQRQQQALDPHEWDAWFVAKLGEYLLPALEPVLTAVAEQTAKMLQDELREVRKELTKVEAELRSSNAREPLDLPPLPRLRSVN